MTNIFSRCWHYFYTSNVLPTDTFEQRMRKLVLGAVGLVSPYMLVDTLTTVCGVYGRTPTQNLVLAIPTASITIISFVSWAVLKRTSVAHEGLMVFMFIVFLFANVIVCLMHPYVPYETLSTVFATACTVMNLHPRTFFIMWVIVLLLQSYNLALTPELGPPLYVYRIDHDSVATRISDQIMKIVSIWATFQLVRTQATEFKTLTQVSELGNRTAKAVAAPLVDYNTKEASSTVRTYRSSVHCDESLAEVLQHIISNMEAYRPFLPNYLMQKEERNSDYTNSQADEEATSATHARDVLSSDRAEDSVVSFGVLCNEPSTSDVFEGPPGTPTHPPVPELFTPVAPFSRDDDEDIPSLQLKLANNSYNKPSAATVSVSRKVVIGLVDYSPQLSTIFSKERHDSASSSETSTTPKGESAGGASPTTNVIDTFFDLADEAMSTVHSLFCDTLHLSWNTARRVVTSECRAAMFLSRVKERLGCAGAAVCGPAMFQFCGERQLVPLVHAPWYKDVNLLLSRYASPLHLSAYDKGIAQNSGHLVRSFMFDAFPTNEDDVLCVFELLEERRGDDHTTAAAAHVEGEEWMYELEGLSTGDDVWCTAATEAATIALQTGDCEELWEC